jgi:hypothetical protein
MGVCGTARGTTLLHRLGMGHLHEVLRGHGTADARGTLVERCTHELELVCV